MTTPADPTGTHDDDALDEAARRMHAPKPGSRHQPDPDPPGGHDDDALDDAARRMAADRQRSHRDSGER